MLWLYLIEIMFFFKRSKLVNGLEDLPEEGEDPVAQHQSLLLRLFSVAYEIQQLQSNAKDWERFMTLSESPGKDSRTR